MARKVMVNGLDIGYIPPSAASDVAYSNTTSGLAATNAQGAIDEVSKSVIYQSAETAVGKWIDGSVIYRRVYAGTGSHNTFFQLDATLNTNNIKPVRIEGTVKKSDGYYAGFLSGTENAIPSLSSTALNFAVTNCTIVEYNVIYDYIKLS